MASTKEFLAFVLNQCAGLDVRVRPMMGEYILYYRDKCAASICDNRFLVKNMPVARALLPDAPLEPPYEGAKEMIVVDVLDERGKLACLLEAIYPHLPAPRPRRKKV